MISGKGYLFLDKGHKKGVPLRRGDTFFCRLINGFVQMVVILGEQAKTRQK